MTAIGFHARCSSTSGAHTNPETPSHGHEHGPHTSQGSQDDFCRTAVSGDYSSPPAASNRVERAWAILQPLCRGRASPSQDETPAAGLIDAFLFIH